MSQIFKDIDNGSPSGPILTLTGNSGGAVSPNTGNIDILGTGSITVIGDPGSSTLTEQLTGLTNHSLILGSGTPTLTNLGVATNGQLPIGSTGADPVLSTLTAGTGITITNGAGSISIAAQNSQISTVTTTDATPTPIATFALGGTAGLYSFNGSISAANTTDSTGGSYFFYTGFRTSGVASSEVGTEFPVQLEDTSMALADFTIAASGNTMVISVIGLAAKTINWKCAFQYQFTGF